MKKQQWVLVIGIGIALALTMVGVFLRKPIVDKARDWGQWFSDDSIAMRALPVCVRTASPDMTIVGYRRYMPGIQPNTAFLAVVVTTPDGADQDSRFEAAHLVLFTCLARHPWEKVSVNYLLIERSQTLDSGEHYMAHVGGVLILYREMLQAIDLTKPIIPQINMLLESGKGFWILGYGEIENTPFPRNADWQLALQRYKKAYESGPP